MQSAMIAFMGLPGGTEWVVIGLIALLIFGRRLPDVARSVGKSIVEFKKGIKDVKDDIDVQSRIEQKPPSSKLEQEPGQSADAAPNSNSASAPESNSASAPKSTSAPS